MLATGLSQQSVLYHSIPLEHAVNLLRNNRLYGLNCHRMWDDGRVIWDRSHVDYDKHQWVKGVNFSRSKHFTANWHHLKPRMILTLDWNKLKTRYKFIPYTWFEIHPKGKGIFKAEAEEFMPLEYTGKSGEGYSVVKSLNAKSFKNRVDNILKYIVSIEFIIPVYAVKERNKCITNAEKLLKNINIPYRISTETAPFLENR